MEKTVHSLHPTPPLYQVLLVYHYTVITIKNIIYFEYGQKYQMDFILQIIYPNGSILKLFSCGSVFFITKRLSEGHVPPKGDT